jgi:hypothetical protein
MSDNLVLEHLRALRVQMDSLSADMRDIKHRVTTLEIAFSSFAATEASHYASVASRIDRLEERLDRIERRLDLVSA